AVWARALIGRVRRWQFRRGFVEQVKLTCRQFLAEADTLFRLALIRDVRLKEADLSDVEALSRSPSLGRVMRLDLSWNEIGDTGVRALAASPHLRQLVHLGLENTWVGGRGLRALAESPK